jgi:hypothetical protein
VGCSEDLGEGADGLRWVGDAVVEDDDGAGGEGRPITCRWFVRGDTHYLRVRARDLGGAARLPRSLHSATRHSKNECKKKPGRSGRDDRKKGPGALALLAA